MGNNYRRSKGCRTCVRRKVKCDERHPTCLRCEKGKFTCERYGETIFINAREQVKKRYASDSRSSSQSRPSPGSTSTSQSRSSSRTENSTFVSTTVSSPAPNEATKIVTASAEFLQPGPFVSADSDLIRSPSLSAFRDEMYVMYTIENLCEGPLGTVYSAFLPFGSNGVDPQQTTMNDCVLALSKVYCGLRTRESRILQDGMRLYGRGLRLLGEVLHDTSCKITTSTIVSVISLGLGESMMPISKSSWMSHILGLERVFDLRGPLTMENSSIFDRALLESFRPIMILGAFFTRKPSIMSRPEWRATTFPSDPEVRPDLFRTSTATPDLSFLMDLLAQLPVLVLEREKCLRLAKTKQSPYATQIKMWTKVVQLRQGLEAWKEQWDIDHDGEVYEVLPPPETNTAQIPPWHTVFSFSSIEVASTFVMHQAVNILLEGFTLSLVKDGLRPSLTIFTPFNSVNPDESQLIAGIETAAVAICRSIEYQHLLLQSSHSFRDFYLFFPMQVARRTLTQRGRWCELAWLASVFEATLSNTIMGIWADMDIF